MELTIGLFMVLLMFLLLATGLYIGIVLFVVAFVGFSFTIGLNGAIEFLANAPLQIVTSPSLLAVPLFILMGQLLIKGGYSTDFFEAALEWTGRLRGGMAMASVAASALFGTCCGSSIATAAAIGGPSVPQMLKYKYSPQLATASVCIGGTLGNMIPPSIPMVVFGIITGASIAKLLIAGLLPGIVLAFIYCTVIFVWVILRPMDAPGRHASTWTKRMVSLGKVWPALAIFFFAVGSIYLGVATPTEAAALGTMASAVIGFSTRRLNMAKTAASLMEAVKIFSTIALLIIGSMVLSRYLAYSGAAQRITDIALGFATTQLVFISFMIVVYLVLGCFMDGLAMVVITVPALIPILKALGIDLIWFGVFMVLMQEIGLITPPVGLNVFVIASITSEVKMADIFKGCVPFVITAIIMAFVFFFFPQIALFLPSLMD